MPSILYLIRHAHAAEAERDEIRALSHRGRAQLKQLAALLGPSGAFTPDEVWHSPLVRARETAELLVHELHLHPKWRERRELEPDADPSQVRQLLTKHHGAIALVGHEPHMSALATLLVTGTTSPIAFTFKKATILALESTGFHWCVRWQLSPDLLAED